MKILMVNKFLYPKGGAETYFLKIGNYLEKHGHQVEYFGMYDEKNIASNSANAYTYPMDFHEKGLKRFLYPFKIIYSLEAKRKMEQVIETFNPDIIHFNNINFQLTPSIIDGAYKKGIPMIQTVHDYQMLCPNHMLFDLKTQKSCEVCLSKSKWNCMKKSCIHGSKVKSLIGSIEAIIYNWRKTYEKVDFYICPSFFMEKKLLSNPIYQNKTTTIHNFIEEITELEFLKKEDYILYFGRLSVEKGFEEFINACKKLPHIKFKIAGTGPLEELCNNIPNVEYVGFKVGGELKELIYKAKFSVYPSIWYENCPLSVLESESLGTPVLASKMGGIPELVENGVTGVLLEEVSEKELCDKIEMLYGNSTLLEEMSQNCLEKRKKMIVLEDYCKKLMRCYTAVLGRSERSQNEE